MKRTLLSALVCVLLTGHAFPQSQPRVKGIPAGGTTGQSLTKASNADFDVHYTTVSGGGASASLQSNGDTNVVWGETITTLQQTAALTANRTGTLPTAAGFAAGSIVVYIDIQTQPTTTFGMQFSPNGTDTINGSATPLTFFSGGGTQRLMSDGVSNWTQLDQNLNILTIRDTTDPTKQGSFVLSGLNTATNALMLWPNLATWAPVTRVPRFGSIASAAAPAINVDTIDEFAITAQAVAITSMTTNLTGTPGEGQKLLIRFKDNGSAQTIAWGTLFIASGNGPALPLTTTAGKYMYTLFFYNTTANKFVLMAVLDNI